jgi:transmembrane sensor
VIVNPSPQDVPISPEMRMEAAAWVSRLRSPQRTWKTELGLANWLKVHPDHQLALDAALATSNHVDRLIQVTKRGRRHASARLPRILRGRRLAYAIATLLLTAIGVFAWVTRPIVLTTQVGEQWTARLEDGSHVYLNTASRVEVKYTRDERRAVLVSGEAMFEVEKDRKRPFVVRVGSRRVTALGTSFLIRRDMNKDSITLIKGKIVIRSDRRGSVPEAAPSNMPTILRRVGQRATFLANASKPQIDHAKVNVAQSWVSGSVAIEDQTLAEAAAELGRYTPLKISVAPEVAQLRIGGLYRATEPAEFARAVASQYQLHWEATSTEIKILGPRSD